MDGFTAFVIDHEKVTDYSACRINHSIHSKTSCSRVNPCCILICNHTKPDFLKRDNNKWNVSNSSVTYQTLLICVSSNLKYDWFKMK